MTNAALQEQPNYSDEEFRAFFASTYNLARYLVKKNGVRNEEDVDDILMRGYAKMAQYWRSHGATNPKALLSQILRTQALDHFKSQKSHRASAHTSFDASTDDSGNGATLSSRIPSDEGSSPLFQLLDKDLRAKFLRVLKDFEEEKDSNLLSLRYVHEMPVQRICDQLGIPLGSYGAKEKKLVAEFQVFARGKLGLLGVFLAIVFYAPSVSIP